MLLTRSANRAVNTARLSGVRSHARLKTEATPSSKATRPSLRIRLSVDISLDAGDMGLSLGLPSHRLVLPELEALAESGDQLGVGHVGSRATRAAEVVVHQSCGVNRHLSLNRRGVQRDQLPPAAIGGEGVVAVFREHVGAVEDGVGGNRRDLLRALGEHLLAGLLARPAGLERARQFGALGESHDPREQTLGRNVNEHHAVPVAGAHRARCERLHNAGEESVPPALPRSECEGGTQEGGSAKPPRAKS